MGRTAEDLFHTEEQDPAGSLQAQEDPDHAAKPS